MRLSKRGLRHLTRWEGCRLEAYQDIAGVWTIGYGHTAKAGPPAPRKGMTITQAQADDLLRHDLRQYEHAVRHGATRPMTQGQFDAMVCLCFNIGAGNFRDSTMLRRFNAGDVAGAAVALTWWNKITKNGTKVKSNGLVNRRKAERKLFLAPEPVEAQMAGGAGAAAAVAAVAAAQAPDWRVWAFAAAAAMVALGAAAWVYRRRIAALWRQGEPEGDDDA